MATTMTTPFATIHRDQPRRVAWPLRLFAGIRRWTTRRRTAAELGALSDAMLHDIGIERWQIPGIARDLAASPGTVLPHPSLTEPGAARPTRPDERPAAHPAHAAAA